MSGRRESTRHRGRTREEGEDADGRHIIEVLLAERAPRLVRHPLWPLLRPPLYALMRYREAVRLADALAPLSGVGAMEHARERLQLHVHHEGRARVPDHGACLLVANHPAGIADGIALYQALRALRPDVCFFANADAQRICPGLEDVLIPVTWPPQARTASSIRATLARAREAIDAGRPIVVFPAGAMARRRAGRLRELPWDEVPVKLARRHALPLVPCHVRGRPSRLRHLLAHVSVELRDMTVFQEFLGRRNTTYRIRFGEVIPPVRWQAATAGDEELVQALRSYVEDDLAHDPEAAFAADGDVSPSAARSSSPARPPPVRSRTTSRTDS